MQGTYENLCVISLNPERHARTCGYWYLVQDRCMPHTAFAERRHLLDWLSNRGLSLEGELAEHGEHSVVPISGRYVRNMHMDRDAFGEACGCLIGTTRTLSNGSYTLGVFTRDAEGIITEHYLNPNVRDRPVYDYAVPRELVG